MKLPEFSVKNSLLVNLFSVFIIVVGVIAMLNLRREVFPQVDLDILTISTVYPSAPAEDVEKLVTIPIEKELKGISGIRELSSSSEEGLSKIGIEIEPSASDKPRVIRDIKDAVERVQNLPKEIEEDPLVIELRSEERPIIEISISGDFPEAERRRFVEDLEDKLLDISGVANVQRIGWRDPEIWVEVDPQKLEEYHVSIEEIKTALQTRNVTLPSGDLTTREVEYSVRTTAEFRTPEEVEEVIIRANDAGNWLRVKDVGRAVSAFQDETRIAKINGKRATAVVVVKNEKSDVVHVVDRVNSLLDEYRKTLPEGMEITITNDYSYYVKRRLNVLKTNGMIGFVLVIAVLFLFLDPIPAVATALGLPIAFFATFMVMSLFDISINLVSMLGLIIVLGMLVDDGIIVSENVYRHIEKGVPPREASIQGTAEVVRPVTVTIMTTYAAFGPLMFMPDIIGKFIKVIPFVVMIALGASLVEAFIILPSHLGEFIRAGRRSFDRRAASTGGTRKIEKKAWYKRLLSFYTRLLNGALNHRYKVLLGIIAFFTVSIMIAVFFMRVILFTGEGIEFFYVRAEARENTPLETMNELIAPVEDLVATLPESELDAFRTFIGSIEREGGWDPNAKRGPHFAQITVFLTPSQGRERRPREIIDSLRPKLDKIKGFEKLYFYLPREGPPVGSAVEVNIKGEEFPVLEKLSGKVADYLKTIPGVSDVNTGYNFGKKQLKVRIDEEKARQYYLTVGQIASAVRNAIHGGLATTVKPMKAEEEIEVLVRYPESERSRLEAFESILIPNAFDNLVPLKAVAGIEETEGFFSISHLDGKRAIGVTASVDDVKATSLEVNSLLKEKFSALGKDYLGYTVEFGGEYEEQMKTQRHLLTSFMIAFFLIFIILAAMFNSLMQPLIVMLAIPFGLMGVIFAFLIHREPLSFFALMGVVGLAGVVVNNSIVLIDFVNGMRKNGKPRRESLVEAGQVRLRPILMTTITTIVGLISVAYGIGGGDPFLKPMALAIIWGLFFASGLTLIVIPCIYAVVDDVSERLLHHATVKTAQADDTGSSI